MGGSPCFVPSCQISLLWVLKCGPTTPKSPKLVFLVYICSKGVYPLKRFFLQNLAWWRDSQVRIVISNFTVLALKMWAYSRKNCEKSQFLVKIFPWKNFGVHRKVEYRCTTTNLSACNDTVIVFIIMLHHSVSVITTFVILKRDKQTYRQKKHHTFSSTAGARPTVPSPHHTWHGDRGGPYNFCTP